MPQGSGIKTRISVNVNAERLGDAGYFMEFMDNLRPSTVTVMHGFGLAETIKSRLPNTKVFFRTDVDKDPDLIKMTPAAFVQRHIESRHSTPDIYGYILNEPVATANLPWAKLLDWLAEVGYRLASAGLPCVMGNLGPGTIPEWEVEKGTFDWYLRMLSETRHIHYAGYHEYTGILLPFGVGQWSRERLTDKTQVQRKDWPTKAQLPRARYHAQDNNGKYLYTPDNKPVMRLPPYWHLRRCDWMQLRTQEIGLPIPRIVLTEYGWDRMPDLTMGGEFNPYNTLQDRFGLVSPHETYRGVVSLRNVFENFFPEMGFDGAVVEQLIWSDEIYPDDIEGLHIFTWSKGSDDWDRQFGCDISPLKLMHQKLFAYVNSTKPVPQPEPDPEPVDPKLMKAVVSVNWANIRSQPNLSAKILDAIYPDDEYVVGGMVTGEPFKGEGRWWIINYDGADAFINRFLVNFESIPELPVYDVPDVNDPRWIVAMAQPMNLYSHWYEFPDNTSMVLGKIYADVMQYFDYSENWYALKHDGVVGFVKKDTMTFILDGDDGPPVGDYKPKWLELHFDEVERKIINGALVYAEDPYPDPGANLKKIVARLTEIATTLEQAAGE